MLFTRFVMCCRASAERGRLSARQPNACVPACVLACSYARACARAHTHTRSCRVVAVCRPAERASESSQFDSERCASQSSQVFIRSSVSVCVFAGSAAACRRVRVCVCVREIVRFVCVSCCFTVESRARVRDYDNTSPTQVQVNCHRGRDNRTGSCTHSVTVKTFIYYSYARPQLELEN